MVIRTGSIDDVKALIVAEYYPRAGDPVGGIWTHRQTLAARDAGADVRVLVLHRPVPPLSAVRTRRRRPRAGRDPPAATARARRSGACEYVRYLSPPRPWSYSSWGAWAAPLLAPRDRRAAPEFPFDLIHAHYAVPAGDAVRRVAPVPRRWSCRSTATTCRARAPAARRSRRRSRHARLVLANSAGTARRCCRARRARHARRAPRRRRAAARARRHGSPDARDRRSSRGAQAPRRRDLGAGAPARPPSAACAT